MEQILVIPREDGVAVSINGKLWVKTMKSEEMMWLAHKCQRAGLEMIRQEQGRPPVVALTPDIDGS